MYVLEEVVTRARAHLVENGYSGSTIGHYESVWRRLSEWRAENAPDGYDAEVGRRYLGDAGLMQDDLPSKQQRFVRRAVERLVEVAETGAPAKTEAPRKYVVPTGLAPAYELYAAEFSRRGLRPTTVSSHLSTARRFFATCGAARPEELGPQSVTAFSSSMSGFSPQTRAGKLHVVCDLARTLSDKGMCGPSLAASMPLIPGHKNSSVPSAYSAEEVSACWASTPRDAARCGRGP